MKNYLLLAIIATTVLFIQCSESEDDLTITSTVNYMNQTLEIKSATLTEQTTDPVSWKLEATSENAQFKITGLLIPLKGTFAEGGYSLGDLNDDGVVNSDDAGTAGYINDAEIELDGKASNLVSGSLTVQKIDIVYHISIDCRDESQNRLQGDCSATLP
ncbi:MAG: hypothetical protein K9G70_05550 [Prolixibacteraceae bacterium]|nr:hypothetical protein [Prolixibacteraceae bacterium]